MVNRERTMMMIVGGLAVVLVGYWGSGKYVKAKQAIEAKHSAKCDELYQVGKAKQIAVKDADRWRAYGSQTLSQDPSQAQTHLRDDLNKLADECGLQFTTVRIDSTLESLGRPIKDRPGFVRAYGASVHAQGKTDQVAEFVYRLSARPYLLRVKTLGLALPVRAEPGLLTLDAKVEGLLLPTARLIRGYVPANPAGPEIQRSIVSAEEYPKTILKRKPFQPSQEIRLKAANPVPANAQPLPTPEATVTELRWSVDPAKDAGYVTGYKLHFAKGTPNALELLAEQSKSQTNVRRDGLEVGPTYYWRVDTEYTDWEGETQLAKGDVWSFTVRPKPIVATKPADDNGGGPPPPPVKVPPADAQFTLASILSSPRGGQYVIIQDRRQANNPNPPEQKVEIGQTLFGGTLIYIEPRGAVSEENETHEWRFHPLGRQLEEGAVPLKRREAMYGDVYELLKLRDKPQGITQAPGAEPETGGEPGLEIIDP